MDSWFRQSCAMLALQKKSTQVFSIDIVYPIYNFPYCFHVCVLTFYIMIYLFPLIPLFSVMYSHYSLTYDKCSLYLCSFHFFLSPSLSLSQCQQYREQATVLENQPSGTFVLQVHAADADEGANGKVKYGLMHRDSAMPAFRIHQDTGRAVTHCLC